MKPIALAWKKVSDPGFDALPPILSSRYYSSLDGLRAVSILLVIAGHLLYAGPYDFLVNGHTGVGIFFAISGFLITTLLLKERVVTQEISLQRFYIRRFLRIFPVAYLYLLVLIPIDIAFHLHISGTNFATAFLYVKNLSMFGTFDWPTGHFWSLAVEEQFYLIFPFILKYAYKVYIRLIIVLIVIIPFSNILFYHPVGLFLHPAPHAILSFFVDLLGHGTSFILWGSLASILLCKGMIPKGFLEKYQGWALFLLFFMILLDTRGMLSFPGKEVFNMYAFGPGICLVILLGIQTSKTFSFAVLNNKLIRRIGVLSYSLYIWQQLFTHYRPWANAFPHADSAVLNLLVLLGVAYVSYHYFEKKFLVLKDRFKPKESKGSSARTPGTQKTDPPPYSIAL